MTKSKALVRANSRRGSRSGKAMLVEGRAGRFPEATVCERCGASFSRRTWRTDRPTTHAFLARARWKVCPACKQAKDGEYCGRVLVRGAFVAAHEIDIRRRIDNVAALASARQPERRLVSVERTGDEIEVLTTSQKLAHRIVQELKKTFRGRARYAWSDGDGSLFAVWQRDDAG